MTEGQNFSSIRYTDPPTKILFHNCAINAWKPLYSIVVKLEDGSFQLYGETLKKINREKYHWPMNSN